MRRHGQQGKAQDLSCVPGTQGSIVYGDICMATLKHVCVCVYTHKATIMMLLKKAGLF